jgi:hypothetical protein
MDFLVLKPGKMYIYRSSVVKGTRPRGRNSALSRCLASASASTHSGPVVVMSPRVPLQGGCEGIQVGGRG